MRLVFFSIISALLVGCVTPRDPIDRLVARRSSDHLWQNGFTPWMPLPATVTIEDVVKREFASHATAPAILKVRQVHVRGFLPDSYSAVLVQTDTGKKIVLLQHQEEGWWVRIYDAKTLAWTGNR